MKHCLNGALWGDIVGSAYEWHPEHAPEQVSFCHPKRHVTDDSVLTLAVAKAILERRPYHDTILELAQAYPKCGFGGKFYQHWVLEGKAEPYGSYGNGAAMRVSPVGWAFHTVEDVLREAEASAACSHDHPMGIASAQAVALAIFLARKGQDKEDIRAALTERFGWSLDRNLDTVRAECHREGFDVTWKAILPALEVFFQTECFEDCIRETVALGCDADTQAAIAGSIAEAYYGPDETLTPQVDACLPPELRAIHHAFAGKFGL